MVKRFDVYVVDLDPIVGSEVGKRRPAVVVSPDVANQALKTVIVAPLTSTLRGWPTRVQVRVRAKDGEVAFDQIRTIDKSRLARKTGSLSAAEAKAVLECLAALFAP